MTENPRLPAETIAYIEDFIGADINRDLVKVAVADQDISSVDIEAPTGKPLNITLDEIKGTQLTGDDWTTLLQTIASIADALNSNGTDQLRVESPSALDVSASEVDVDINSQSQSPLTTTDDGSFNVNDYTGSTVPTEQQTPVQIENSSGTNIDPLAAGDQPLDVSASEVDVDINTQTASPLTVTDDGALAINAYNGTTLPTEQQTPVGVEDSAGTQINPDQSPEYPETAAQQDLIGTGDLTIGPVAVSKSQSILIAGNSTDGNTWSASVAWQDDSGNVVQNESASDVNLSSVTDDFARLIRKGSQVQVTFTDESSGSANNINVYVDAHR